MKITYKDITANEEINQCITMGNEVLGAMGYTEHSKKHAAIVAAHTAQILEELRYSGHDIELGRIAGYMHDIGNCVNRHDHAHSGAIMAFHILRGLNMPPEDVTRIVSAIGNHDEKTGTAVTPISAALILADKTDVRRNRVRNKKKASYDIHDRVNYAVYASELIASREKGIIHLNIKLDEDKCSILDYFEIFTERMLMCRRASELLNMHFKFTVNDRKVL